MKHVLIGLLHAYRLLISPLYGQVCRYHPTCSAYALRAVSVHGAIRGSWLAGRRLLRCHPWARGGYDPVPGTPEWEQELAEQAQHVERGDQPRSRAGLSPSGPHSGDNVQTHDAHDLQRVT